MDDDTQIPLSTLRRLYDVSVQIGAGRSLRDTMQAVVDGVVNGLGFGVAVTNLRHENGTYEAIAVAGSDAARQALQGKITGPEHFQIEFDRADAWGSLLFVPHERVTEDDDYIGWVPDIDVPTDPDAWHPLDALFAPLTSATGDLVGVLSVDLPEDGQRPDTLLRELLELLAVQAGIAIDTARLAERVREDQAKLFASDKAFRLAFEGSSTAMATVSASADTLGTYLRVNDAFEAIDRSVEEPVLGRSIIEYLDRVEPSLATMFRRDPSNLFGEPVHIESLLIRQGEPLWLQSVITLIDPGPGAGAVPAAPGRRHHSGEDRASAARLRSPARLPHGPAEPPPADRRARQGPSACARIAPPHGDAAVLRPERIQARQRPVRTRGGRPRTADDRAPPARRGPAHRRGRADRR